MKMKITQENKRKRSPTTIVLFFLKVHQTTQPTVGVSTPHLRSLQLSRALVVDWKMKEGDEMLMLVVGRVLMHRLGQFNKTEMQGWKGEKERKSGLELGSESTEETRGLKSKKKHAVGQGFGAL